MGVACVHALCRVYWLSTLTRRWAECTFAACFLETFDVETFDPPQPGFGFVFGLCGRDGPKRLPE
jgi:hypothetical protein